MRKGNLLLLIFAFALFNSCTKGPDSRVTDDTIATSVEGSLFLSSNAQLSTLAGIKVECGDQEVTLDSSGNFFFTNVTLPKKLACIVARLNGKIILTKSFVPNGRHNFLRGETWETIYLGGSFQTTSDYSTGSTYGLLFKGDIPANSFGGTTAKFTFADYSPFLDNNYIPYGPMPGNFYAEDDQGNITGLQVVTKFFYMEVQNNSGVLLDLLPGKKISIMKNKDFVDLGNAPYFVYFFDAGKGVWRKAGDATYNSGPNNFTATSTKINGYFVVAHPYEVVKFSGKITAFNAPVYSLVRINKVGEMNHGAVAYANANGEINGYLPKGENVEISLVQPQASIYFSYNYVIFKKALGVFNNDADLGEIACSNMGDTTERALLTFKGKVVDCNNNPIPNALVADGNIFGRHFFPTSKTNASGEFVLNFTRGVPQLLVYAVAFKNPSNNQWSQIVWPMYNNKDIKLTAFDLGKITICNANTSEFMTFIVDGQTIDYRPPATPLQYYNPFTGIADPNATINEFIKSASGNLFDVGFYGNRNIGQKPLSGFLATFAPISQLLNGPIYVNVTENRNSGSSYLAGSFQNMQVKYTNGTTHTISCSFRVKN